MDPDSTIRRILYFMISILRAITNPMIRLMFRLWYDRSVTSVTPIEEAILLMTATTLAKKIRNRELRSVDVMKTFIQRAKHVNPVINCIVFTLYDEAIQQAERVDAILDAGKMDEKFSEANAPFLGVPVSIKECFAMKGCPQSTGLVSRKDVVRDYDAPVVALLKASGAIPYITTNTSELCMWLESSNFVYGTTRNAYNTTRMVGGSSGGEACAVTSGAAVFGVGSDIGGSIRIPAFCNGVFGHRTTNGVVCNDEQYPPADGRQNDLLSTGPICRYAADLLPMLRVMAGKNVSQLRLEEKVDVKRLQIFTMEDDGGSIFACTVEPELKQAQKTVERYLQSIGCQVHPVKLSQTKYAIEMWMVLMNDPSARKFTYFMGNEEHTINPFTELVRAIVRKSQHTIPAIMLGLLDRLVEIFPPSAAESEMYLKMAEDFRKELKDLLGEDGVLLYPSHPWIAPYHNEPIMHPFDFSYTAMGNVLAFPITQCPVGLSKDGLPMGVQVIGAPFQDHITLAVARELEVGLGGWVSPGL